MPVCRGNWACKSYICLLYTSTAGIKLLGSKDAKKIYAHTTAAALRAKEGVMKTVTAVREDVYKRQPHLLQNRKKHGIILLKEPNRSYLRRRELGFYRLRDRAAPQGTAEGNETLCLSLIHIFLLPSE